MKTLEFILFGFLLGMIFGTLIGGYYLYGAHNKFLKSHACYDLDTFEKVTAHMLFCELAINNSWEKSQEWWNSSFNITVRKQEK